MKKNVIVREYVDDDFESLIELYKNSLTYGGQYDEARDTRDKLLATAEDLCLFVAAADNEVIGSVISNYMFSMYNCLYESRQRRPGSKVRAT